MKITTLVENTSISNEYKHKHGLSLYIETENHKILFDLGSNSLFLENAAKLNIDIGLVDTVVISHGHSDHGGALSLFLQKNKLAKVYVHKSAFDKYYTKFFGLPIYVGLDSTLKNYEQIVLNDGECIIDDEIRLFSKVTDREFFSKSNNALYVKTNMGMKHDSFGHEQNLIIKEKDKYVLVAGCAHNGIINIQNKAEQLINKKINYVVSGLHLYNPVSKKQESDILIKEVAYRLKSNRTKYYTCHCTGKKAFESLKNIMNEQISYISTGSSIEL